MDQTLVCGEELEFVEVVEEVEDTVCLRRQASSVDTVLDSGSKFSSHMVVLHRDCCEMGYERVAGLE